jgi:hypothetical protein
MPLTKISVDSIASSAVTNIAIADGTIVSVDLADQSVITSKLADANVTTSKIANAGVTSPKLAQNLNISLTRVLEEANISTLALGGNVNIDVTNSTVYFFNANTTANLTFNLRANNTHTFDSVTTVGETTSVAIAVKHGTDRHSANLHIDGGLITGSFAGSQNSMFYGANVKPIYRTITNGEVNLFSYSVFKTAANSYIVVAANSLFGLG